MNINSVRAHSSEHYEFSCSNAPSTTMALTQEVDKINCMVVFFSEHSSIYLNVKGELDTKSGNVTLVFPSSLAAMKMMATITTTPVPIFQLILILLNYLMIATLTFQQPNDLTAA